MSVLETLARALSLASLTMVAGTALAHGDQAHAKKPVAVKKEQKEWGIAGDANAVKQTVKHEMLDAMRFTPDKVDVKVGDTVKFVIHNDGKIMHEFVIGTKKELDEHAALMAKFPNMEHDEPYMAHVAPGKTGEVVWTFNRAGEFDFACLIPGHYQAGMVGKIRVAAAFAQSTIDASKTGDILVAQAATGEMADGEVRKVDKENKKLTLKHGEIKSLEMPPMTMVFKVKDPAVLDKLQAGDKVKFKAENIGGALTVMALEPAR